MSEINPIGTSNTSTQTQAASATTGLDSNAFLQLLVAQLKYQNPMNPADPTQFMTQTAQFTMVEDIEKMQKQFDASIAAERATAATTMLGRHVQATLFGANLSGTVTKVAFDATNGPSVYINGDNKVGIPITAIQEVS